MNNGWKEKGYYYEVKKGDDGKEIERIKLRLLLDDAKKWAEKFVKARPELKSAQIRRFYHDVKALQAKIDASGEGEKRILFEKNLPLIKMLKSKVAYACPKTFSSRKVPMEFREFMDACIDGIDDQKDFEAFTLVFEAVVGYFYGEGGRQS
ncbi:MAG: type III-A CRISPR-associated protein Csm2 [Planctomycetes bacterium GWC2_39_26]|nr:MAG: type III-A CRISPR-associated protein Csm2 [Planctomycetes bacterium GWC2_39_26]